MYCRWDKKKKAYVNTAGADDSSKRGLKVRKVGKKGVLMPFGTAYVHYALWHMLDCLLLSCTTWCWSEALQEVPCLVLKARSYPNVEVMLSMKSRSVVGVLQPGQCTKLKLRLALTAAAAALLLLFCRCVMSQVSWCLLGRVRALRRAARTRSGRDTTRQPSWPQVGGGCCGTRVKHQCLFDYKGLMHIAALSLGVGDLGVLRQGNPGAA